MTNGVSVRGREFLQYKAFDATLMNAENNILMSFVGNKKLCYLLPVHSLYTSTTKIIKRPYKSCY